MKEREEKYRKKIAKEMMSRRRISSKPRGHSHFVRRLFPYNVHFSHKNSASHNHGDQNDGDIHAEKFHTSHVNMFSGEDITPKEAGKRSAERRAERTIVDANCHAVDSCPECSVADGDTASLMNLLPLLDNSTK